MKFNSFDDQSSFNFYRMALASFTAWPQIQNLNHMFAQMNLSE